MNGGAWQVGIDIGGTFTDAAALRADDSRLLAAKVPSDPEDHLASVRAALAALDIAWPDVDDLIHGTTLVTNAVVQDRLSKVALVTTEGFGDTLAIGRQNRRHLYRLDLPPKVQPQVPEALRFEIRERLDHRGEILSRLSEEAVEGVTEQVRRSGVAAVAVSLLHAYANPRHEQYLARRLRAVVPNVALSHRVSPETREYERTATTVLSAAVMPLVARYFDDLESQKPASCRLHMFHSAGGMASTQALRELPLGLALSGPAAGVSAAARVSRELGIEQGISFDMGGTTTDVCLIVGARADVDSERILAERPLRQPMVAVDSIGAGGGSIGRLATGALQVGPDSAGAAPGPACYGRGGAAPTVTDANLVLGYLDPERRLGASVRLDPGRAERALAPLARGMGAGVVEAALGIIRVVNANMARALRRVTVERGIDGRSCTLLAFGGAGPMHSVGLARSFGMRRVLVPNLSSVFSALGCLSAEKSYAQQQTVRMAAGEWNPEHLGRVRDTLVARLSTPLGAAGHGCDEVQIEDIALVRYAGQSYAIEVAAPALGDRRRLERDFRAEHERLYGFAPDEPCELVAVRVRVSVPREARAGRPVEGPRSAAAPWHTAPAWFAPQAPIPTPRYPRSALAGGQAIAGPAIVEDEWSTVVVPPGATLTVDAFGHLHIDVGEEAA